MRIVHILDHSLPIHSGYTFRSQNIFRAQAKHGWELAVITSPKHQESHKGEVVPQESLEGFPHFRTHETTSSRLRGYYEQRLMAALHRRIKELVADFKPDIIHAHSPVLNALPALRVGKEFGIPVVYEIRAFWEDAAADHGSYREGSWKYRLVRQIESYACRKANHIAVICDGLRRDLASRGIPIEKISIVGNGVNTEDFAERPPDKDLAASWNLQGKAVIGFMGSFYRYEGLDLLIDAFALAVRRNRDFRLLLVGGGEMESMLKEKVRNMNLTDSVIFPGRIPHERIPGVYAISDVLVYPRKSMRLTDLVTPLKPLEAMAMGKAVIASDVGGHKELIKDGETGALFPADDSKALAATIEKLLLNKELRSSLAQNGKNWVRRERTWDKTTSVYVDVYNSLLAGKLRSV